MVTLGSLHDWRQTATILSTFLCILNELVLLEEVLKGAFLASHLILQDLNFRLKPHVFLLERVAGLFQLHYLVLELFGDFVAVDAMRSCQRPSLFLSMYRGAITLSGSHLALLAFSCRSNVLHGVSGMSGMHILWLRMLPVMLPLRILILSIEAILMCLA